MDKLEDPTLTTVIQEAIKARLLDVHTSIPGKVIEYDETTQTASIQPLLKRKFKGQDKPVELPVLNKVPVRFPGGLDSFLHFPIKAGVTGLINFCERSIDSWQSGDGSCVSPDDPRSHDLSDGTFTPDLRTLSQAFSGLNPDNVTLKNSSMKIELDPSGKISITGASDELVSVLVDFADHVLTFIGNVKTANIIVGSGSSAGNWPFTPADIIKFVADEAAVTSDKSKLNGFKI